MKPIKVYSWAVCPYCVRAKELLKSKNLDFEDISLDGKRDELLALVKQTGQRTVPQIFIGDQFIGGFSELAQLESDGKLDALVNS